MSVRGSRRAVRYDYNDDDDDGEFGLHVFQERNRRRRMKELFMELQTTLEMSGFPGCRTKIETLEVAIECIDELKKEQNRLVEKKRELKLLLFDKQCTLEVLKQCALLSDFVDPLFV